MSREKIVGLVVIALAFALLSVIVDAFRESVANKKEAEAITVTYEETDIKVKVKEGYIDYISMNDEYVEKGVTAYYNDRDVSNNFTITYYKNGHQVSKVDTSVEGTYLVKYTVYDDEKEVYGYASRVVVVTD